MRKKFSIVLLVSSCLIFLIALSFCIYSFIGLSHDLDQLANDHNVSGIDFLGVGWGYGIILFLLSLTGLLFSIVSGITQERKRGKCISSSVGCLFILLLFVAVFLFYR